MAKPIEVQYLTIHGHERAFVKVGKGPALLLLHGLGCDHTTWLPVIAALARRYTVIAPDLLGHGRSAKPRADYSLGGYANGMRDLLTVLGVDKVTVVGHSFGGGVAMQFAYQFPERTERMVLVAPGGLGPDVSPAIRAITLPGFHQVMGVVSLPGVRHLAGAGLRALAASGLPQARDLDEVAKILVSFRDPHARRAIRHVVSCRGRLAWPGRHDGGPRLPHPGDADVRDLGDGGLGHPGPARRHRRGVRARRHRRGDRRRRALPAQGPPTAVREDPRRLHPDAPSRRSTTADAGARCSGAAGRPRSPAEVTPARQVEIA